MPSPREAKETLQNAMEEAVSSVNLALDKLIPETDLAEGRLAQAMRYGVLNGGKRLRPFLVMESSKLFNVDPACARRVAAAVELVHSYSLIHDDLPSMDNAALRRGKPTTHKAFDEPTALLAGDALLTLAFEIISDHETHEDPRVRLDLLNCLAKAAGPQGMVGGQMLDLLGEKETFDVGTISRLQRMKTGMLMAFACEAGAILGKSGEPQRKALRNYAYDLGLAFQVTDDILDVEADPQDTGKDQGGDAKLNKSTFVSTLGKDNARARAEMLVEQAKAHLALYRERADTLREIADYVLQRRA